VKIYKYPGLKKREKEEWIRKRKRRRRQKTKLYKTHDFNFKLISKYKNNHNLPISLLHAPVIAFVETQRSSGEITLTKYDLKLFLKRED
jgi:hypothetical protein